jgi:adenylate kinase family enzyme
MPLLGPSDALPRRPGRVLVAGTSGSGKTTLAARIAEVLGIPCVEIDALFHGPDWTPRPSFDEDVRRFSAGPRWVTEWQYGSVRPHLAGRADLLVWLDLPRPVVMRQVVRRTLARRLRRQSLWNGNVEPPLRRIFTDPEHVVRWAWSTHARTAPRIGALLQERPDLTVVRLRSHEEARHWLGGPLRRFSDARPGT